MRRGLSFHGCAKPLCCTCTRMCTCTRVSRHKGVRCVSKESPDMGSGTAGCFDAALMKMMSLMLFW